MQKQRDYQALSEAYIICQPSKLAMEGQTEKIRCRIDTNWSIGERLKYGMTDITQNQKKR